MNVTLIGYKMEAEKITGKKERKKSGVRVF